MRQLLKEERIYGLRFEGGDKLGFLKDTVEFALKRSDLREDFAQARTYFRSAGSFYTQMLAGEQPNFGDGEQSREFTYIANMVQANVLAACAPAEHSASPDVLWRAPGGQRHDFRRRDGLLKSGGNEEGG